MKKLLDWLLNRERTYFVSYMMQMEGGRTAYKHATFDLRGRISGLDQLEAIAGKLKSVNLGCNAVVIISLQRLPV